MVNDQMVQIVGARVGVEAFRRFVERARALRPPEELPVAQFREFVARATPLATAHVRGSIERLAEIAPPILHWLLEPEQDVLAVAGYAWVETAYTNLVAWALYPPGRPDVALACQRAWVNRCAPGIVVEHAVKPLHQLVTDDGIPDLVFEYGEDVLIVEAKTKTFEHAIPSGQPQTIGYVASVAKHLGCDPERCHVVLLTPDRRAPANPRARAASYADFVLALSPALAMVSEDESLFHPYLVVMTHFLRCSLPNGVDAGSLLERICRWQRQPSDSDASEILRELDAIQLLASLLLPMEET